jgi:hypothetical protein
MKPICYDLYGGLFGWGAAFVSEGYRVVAFDILDMHKEIGLPRPTEIELVLQDVRTVHGSQLKDAAVIVASPPCQKYSYMAMPWSRAKKLREWYRDPEHPERIVELNELFNACFRIQREANEAICSCACWRCKDGGHCVRCDCFGNTGKYPRYIPMIVENVRGAQEWVGRSVWNFGSFHLWGDVPALMPITSTNFHKVSGQDWNRFKETGEVSPHWRMEAHIKQGGDWFGANCESSMS